MHRNIDISTTKTIEIINVLYERKMLCCITGPVSSNVNCKIRYNDKLYQTSNFFTVNRLRWVGQPLRMSDVRYSNKLLNKV